MIDPRQVAILVEENGAVIDKTAKIETFQENPTTVQIVYTGRSQPYNYRRQRVTILDRPTPVRLDANLCVEVHGSVWTNATTVLQFGPWTRVFYRKGTTETYRTYPASDVHFVHSVAQHTGPAQILAYLRAALPPQDPLYDVYAKLKFVHADSALARYLEVRPIETSDNAVTPIFPFASNLSQNRAVEQALRQSISVIEGPPGTGKTQTILNLIANIICSDLGTVGVVSFNNAAVDNVRDKLVDEGFGYAVANLGNQDKQQKFFAAQPTRNAEVRRLVEAAAIPMPSPKQVADLGRTLRRWQEADRRLAQARQEIDAYLLEHQHFEHHLERHELPDLDRLPLLRRSPERILDYLAETAMDADETGRMRQLVRKVRSYLRYGPTGQLDADTTEVVLALQRTYYERRISALRHRIEQAEKELRRADFAGKSAEHRELSIRTLRGTLQQRYAAMSPTTYTQDSYRRSGFAAFGRDYPVILSTCHSLARSLPDGYLLDYLIIDESSQVSLLAAAPALACARTVVIVGDLRQLQPVVKEVTPNAAAAPAPAYDYLEHSIQSSFIDLYGEALTSTMLREHYRCDPAIIGFCNKTFYGGQLVPFTTSTPGSHPLRVVRTVEGNHMRQHRDRGRSNQREVDVIVQQVIPQYCSDVEPEDIGITTPYRRQVDKLADSSLIEGIANDTVHKFQGRQKEAIIMTTVLDETWRGRLGTDFVDDPHLVNVAVSRAGKRFLLVTNHSLMPTSRNIGDLIGYIQYHNPNEPLVEGSILSVFDLLYRDYSARLQPLARRLRTDLRYKSENIMLTVLRDILAEDPYTRLEVVPHVLLNSTLPDLTRLTAEQATYVRNRAELDFVIYNRITLRLVLAIEVDGFKFHEDNPAQLAKDALKNAICATYEIPLLRLPTTGSEEHRRIRERLDALLEPPAGPR
ncbi:AAA domain-containing protein [Nocardia macrotermitis]|uniref:RecBCD enzyme subunit RecD n=1 Tax=Nocardia macrotermitis TaxID=2585198 RepID=A0A7K0CYG8_9NOCA|nr:AAA domain-containing protein [Nocardia macrotermitis]MQY18529.1 RecBCD enzyme subunit RecD [Nocardia macrotermitis]